MTTESPDVRAGSRSISPNLIRFAVALLLMCSAAAGQSGPPKPGGDREDPFQAAQQHGFKLGDYERPEPEDKTFDNIARLLGMLAKLALLVMFLTIGWRQWVAQKSPRSEQTNTAAVEAEKPKENTNREGR